MTNQQPHAWNPHTQRWEMVSAQRAPWIELPIVVVAAVLFCWPVGLVLLWRHPRAPLWAKRIPTIWCLLSVAVAAVAIARLLG